MAGSATQRRALYTEADDNAVYHDDWEDGPAREVARRAPRQARSASTPRTQPQQQRQPDSRKRRPQPDAVNVLLRNLPRSTHEVVSRIATKRGQGFGPFVVELLNGYAARHSVV